MLHPDLQNLMEIAIRKGEVSQKERDVLHRKAKDLGQDIDELDMIIEGELYKIKKSQNPEEQVNFSCPSCGASIPKSSIKCGFCGFEISKKSATGEDYINKLSEALAKIDNDHYAQETKASAAQMLMGAGDHSGYKITQAKASAISTFTMPNDKEHLLEFFYFCDTNGDSCFASAKSVRFNDPSRGNHKILGNAWAGKAKMTYSKLSRFAKDDEEIAELFENYKNKYYEDPTKMKASSVSTENSNKAILFGLNQQGVITAVALLLFCFPLCWIPFILPQFKADK